MAEQVQEYGVENLEDLRRDMNAAADALEFERAALLRDRIKEIEGDEKHQNKGKNAGKGPLKSSKRVISL